MIRFSFKQISVVYVESLYVDCCSISSNFLPENPDFRIYKQNGNKNDGKRCREKR